RTGEPGRQAGARHVQLRRPVPGRGPRRGRGVRGRAGRRGGRSGRRLRFRCRGRPHRPGRGAAAPRRRHRRLRPGRSPRPQSSVVIDASVFKTEPWLVRESSLDLDVLAQSESIFALSNGHLGLRGNLDEGEPYGLPGTYLNSFFELRPLPYAEAGYGYPEEGQTIVDITNGKIIRLLVDDEPFDVRYGDLQHHERVLDFRAGTLTRNVR